ncbi:3-beta-glucanase 1) (Exo-1 [Durusdinium trenchii]|uniref:3-beta-glucanase 1) (Exo-1 n=1 Tax=Durusdinium trenchii TaxID=1381693 RepID=A0ABP0PTH7_9DINO
MPWAGPEMDLCKKVCTADSWLIRNPTEFKCNSFGPTNVERTCWRGVNLGGWLVLEKWMAPELFSVAPSADDELSLLTEGGNEARDAVTRFRDTFITQQDLHWLRYEGGIDAVRLPVGFWCIDDFAKGTPFLSTQRYVDAVFDWAEKYGLKILLELHGLVGSQNGEHHSGECRPLSWLQPANRKRNLDVIRACAERWGSRESLLGFGLGNEVGEKEPTWLDQLVAFLNLGYFDATRFYWASVADFYTEAAGLVQKYLHPDAILVLDTCWDMERWTMEALQNVPGKIWLDYHHYQCMGSEPGNVREHCQALEFQELMTEKMQSLPVIIGEFSLALQPNAEGYGDGTSWPKRFFQRQVGIAEKHAAAWFFWNYKIAREGWPHWSYRESVERGWIEPQLFGKPGHS